MSISKQFDAAISNIESKIEKQVEDVTFEVFDKVRTKSPVDTGAFRIAWKIEEAEDGYLIRNDLPYAHVIEYGLYPNPPKNPTGKTVNGYSRQAPKGVARISVKEVAEKWK